MKRRFAWFLGAGLFVLTAVLDLVTKTLAEEHLARPIWLVDQFAGFRLAYNRGVAFSALEGLPHWMLGVGAIVLLGTVIWGLRSMLHTKIGAAALGLVAAGGVCNAIDRLADGRVTDMISVWKWPVFNVADTGITIGVALLFLASRKAKTAPVAAAPADPEAPPAAS